MIKITYYLKYHQVTIEGHAQAAPKGEDLVCAAVSALWHTLAANAMVWKDQGYLMDLRIKEIEGYAQVSYAPKSKWANILGAITGGICIGLEILARDYPEHITYQRMG